VLAKPEPIGRKFFSPPPAPVAEPAPEAKPISIQAPPVKEPDPKPEVKPEPPVKLVAPPSPPPAPVPAVKKEPVKPATAQSKLRDTIFKYTPKNILFAPGEPFILDDSS
jgi:hypothetical protein